MAIISYYKQPGERYPIGVDFVDRLPVGTSIVSATVTVFDEAGVNAAATILDGAATVSGSVVVQTIKAGVNGQRYDMKFIAALAASAGTVESDITLFVREE